MKPVKSQWRTVLLAALLGGYLLIALYLCGRMGELGAQLFPAAAWSLVLMLVATATKSGIEHLAGGGGVKGATAALMTNVKPEPPKEEPQP